MQTSLPLFDEPSGFDRQELAARLDALAKQNILIGGSSWKYEGWLGQIYSRERYTTRGRFSQKRFQQECLAEYAETFPIVCGDFSFYQFPSDEFWRKLFAGASDKLQFALKIPEEITCRTFPNLPRYGLKAGKPNPGFLDASLFQAAFLDPLRPFRNRVSVLIFEFGTFGKGVYRDPGEFFAQLDDFLGALETGWRYSVEVRNPEFLIPEYFAILNRHGVAHVFNSWNRMPPLEVQVSMPGAHTAPFTVVRALLRAGRAYEQAVALFSPYDRVQDVNTEARETLRSMIESARRRQEALYLFINNRLEGNAPGTMMAVTEDL